MVCDDKCICCVNKRPPGLIAPLLRFWHLLRKPPKNTTKCRDLIFNEGIRLLNMADTSLYRFTLISTFEVIQRLYLIWRVIYVTVLFTHKKLSKINIRSSLSRFVHCSESLIYPLGSHIWSLFAPIHMKSWPKVKLGKVQVGLNIARSHSYTHRKSYLAIICPYSHEKLTKGEIRSSSSQFKHCSESFI